VGGLSGGVVAGILAGMLREFSALFLLVLTCCPEKKAMIVKPANKNAKIGWGTARCHEGGAFSCACGCGVDVKGAKSKRGTVGGIV